MAGCDGRHSRLCHITQPCALVPGGLAEVDNSAIDPRFKDFGKATSHSKNRAASVLIFGQVGAVEDDGVPGRRHGDPALYIAPQDPIQQRRIHRVGA